MNLQKAVRKRVARYKSIRAAGEALGIDRTYLMAMMKGKQFNPSNTTLEKLKLVKVINYIFEEDLR